MRYAYRRQFGVTAGKQRPLKLSLGTYRSCERLTREAGTNEIYCVDPRLKFFGITEIHYFLVNVSIRSALNA